MTRDRAICIHGHFYQPPRENPWREAVEAQDSASPFHDWNERIAAECYSPCSRARLLDAEGRVRRVMSAYARMSFNVGPTLLSWMEAADPRTYQAILDADRESQPRFQGHGAAIAAHQSIRIGTGSRIGPFCAIADTDFHVVGRPDEKPETSPIDIGPGVRLGARVTVLRGAVIGEGASVESGSVVSGVVPAGACVGSVRLGTQR